MLSMLLRVCMHTKTQTLKERWDAELYNINVIMSYLNLLMEGISLDELINKGRGRKPSRDVEIYVKIIVIKELEEHTLRTAEHEDAKLVRQDCRIS